MNKFFKSRFFIITATVAMLLTVVVSALAASGHFSVLTNAVNIMVTPIQKGFASFGLAINGYKSYFDSVDGLKAENEALKAEINELKDLIYDAEAMKEENEFYKNFLGIKEENPDYVFLDADVIGRQAGNYMTVFSLDKGTKDGVEKNMPIISENGGIVGYISEAGINWSKASSIIDTSASVGVYIERTSETGVLCGEFQLEKEGLCRINYLEGDSGVEVGDRVMTSGLGSIYPQGMLVGIVERVEYDDSLRSKYAVVRPFADITDIEKVMILTSFEGEN